MTYMTVFCLLKTTLKKEHFPKTNKLKEPTDILDENMQYDFFSPFSQLLITICS